MLQKETTLNNIPHYDVRKRNSTEQYYSIPAFRITMLEKETTPNNVPHYDVRKRNSTEQTFT